MADIVVTVGKVAIVFPEKAEIIDYIAGEAVTKGEAVYVTSTGKLAASGSATVGVAHCVGLALNKGAAGMAVSVLKKGHVEGFTLAGNPGTKVYLSDTAGTLADAGGTKPNCIGQVVSLTDKALSKVLYVDIDMTRIIV